MFYFIIYLSSKTLTNVLIYLFMDRLFSFTSVCLSRTSVHSNVCSKTYILSWDHVVYVTLAAWITANAVIVLCGDTFGACFISVCSHSAAPSLHPSTPPCLPASLPPPHSVVWFPPTGAEFRHIILPANWPLDAAVLTQVQGNIVTQRARKK